MKKMMKRLLSFVMVIVMMIPLVPATLLDAAAADKTISTGICGDNLVYRFDVESGEMTFTGWGAMNDYGWNTNLAPWYNQKKLIKSVFVDHDITHLGSFTFSLCENLTSITLENGLKSIGNGAFERTSLSTVVLPNGLKTLGIGVFKSCNKLKRIYFPSSITEIRSNPFILCETIPEIYVVNGSYAAEYFLSKSDLAPYVKFYSGIVNSLNSPVFENEEEKVLKQLEIKTENMLQNISCGNHTIKGPSITFLGKTFYLFEYNGKVDLEFAGIPLSVSVDSSTKTIKFLVGFKDYSGSVDINGANNDTKYWSQSYQKVKSMYKTITGSKVDTPKLWNQFSSVRGSLKEMRASLLVSAKCYVAGYLEMSYKSGSPKFSEGGILMEASIDGEFTGRFPFPAAYAVLGLKASLNGKISIAYENYISMLSELGFDLTANIGVGFGTKNKICPAYIEGGLKGTLGADIIFASGKFRDSLNNYSPLTITLSGQIYLKGALSNFVKGEKKWPIGEPVQIYPKNNISLNSTRSMFSLRSEDSLAEYTPLPRDYLYTPMLFMLDNSDKIYSDKSVYDYNAPVITTLSDGSLMMLWVDDLGTKNDINRTSLMYSIYNENEWSEPTELFETGTYNGEPVIYNDGTNVHIAWSKAKAAMEDTAGLEDLITEIEVYYTRFNGTEFSEPEILTSNSIMEASYNTTASDSKTAIAWVENSDNDPYMESGTNTLYVRECINGIWGEKQALASSESPLGEINLFYADNELNYAYAVLDAEGNSSIYLNGELLCAGGYISYENGRLFYLADSTVMVYDINTKEASETGLSGVENFSIYNGNAYTLVSTGFTTEMYESMNTDGTFADWKQVTEFDRYIRNYSVTADSNGTPIYALNLVTVDEESESVYGLSELAVCGATEIDALTASAVYYDEDSVAPGDVLPLNIDIVNTGSTDITSLTVEILDSEDNVISTEIISCSIPYGQEGTIICNYTLPSELALHDIKINITGSENERITGDNIVSTSIGYADIVIESADVVRTADGAETDITITNFGFEDATSVVVSVYDSDAPEVIIDTFNCDDIPTGGNYTYTYSIPEEYLTLEDKLTMHGLTFKVESDAEELNYANNSDIIVFGELTDYTVSIVENNVLLDIISVSEFADYTLTKPGHKIEGWYTTPDFLEGTKITEIPEDISENLVLYVKWEAVDFSKILTFSGFQVRKDDYNGLRYRFTADFSKIDELEDDGFTVVEFGTLMAASSKLASLDELTVSKNESGEYDTLSFAKRIPIYRDGAIVNKYISKADDKLSFACTIVKYNVSNFDLEVTARGYAIVKDAAGNEYVVYADYPNENYRSLSLERVCDELSSAGLIDTSTNISYIDVAAFKKERDALETN